MASTSLQISTHLKYQFDKVETLMPKLEMLLNSTDLTIFVVYVNFGSLAVLMLQ